MDNMSLIQKMPPMLSGSELEQALTILPEYDPAIVNANEAMRLIALTDLYKVFVPSMNYIISNEPSITGIVKETNENAILIENDNGEYWVSLNVENKDSVTNFNIGDEIVVYYDGNIAESYPMQINTVYAITLKTPADRAENNKD